MFATAVTVRDPFNPWKRESAPIQPGCSIRSLAPDTDQPFIILRNGNAVLRADWEADIEEGDILAVVILPQGGDQGGSNPLRMVLMMAVMVMAPVMAGELALGSAEASFLATGTLTSATEMAMMTSMYSAGIAFAGMALVNALVPAPKPPSTQQAASLAAASPTYSIQAQGNVARLDSAIPAGYGRLRVFPDFAAQPYIEYAGNEQYVYQLLCLGKGEYDIEATQIDDTDISSWEEVEIEVIPPGGAITKFPVNVITSVEVTGQELATAAAGTYTQSAYAITVTQTGHGLTPGRYVYLDITSGASVDGSFAVATTPTPDTFTVTDTVSRTTSGNVTVQPWLGHFVANTSGTVANTIGIDVALPRGLYSYDTGTGALTTMAISFVCEARQIDDTGAVIGVWTGIGSETISDSTTTPHRYSFRYTPATPGRYQIRMRRLDVKSTLSTVGHEIDWVGLRAYLPETRTFGNVTLLAARMRASNSLSMQASRKINVVCTRRLPIWDGSTWSAPTATRSIAWAVADVLRNTDYGAGFADKRIDLAGLLALNATWSTRGDEFNGRFDNTITVWEALTKILQVGRAKPFMQGGVVRAVRDQQQTVPVAMFSGRNIKRGSFTVEYLMPTMSTADAVDGAYFDAGTWSPGRVQAKLPGSAALNSTKIDLTVGCTSRDQAFREGMYQCADNFYRRGRCKFTTEMEGFIPSYGDLIAILHDMVGWGQVAEVVAWNASTRVMTLSEPMTWGTGTHYIGLRKRDGGLDGPYVVTAGVDAWHVVLAIAPGTVPYTGGSEERTHVAFGWGETWRQLAKVTGITPRGLYDVEIQAVVEDNNVHTAELGVVTPTAQTSQLTTIYTAPEVASLVMRSSPSDVSKALLCWESAPGADRYLIEVANTNSADAMWTRVGETSANNYAVTAIYGASTWFRVCAIGLTKGPWVTMLFGSVADYMWEPASDLVWSVGTDLVWS